MLIFVSDLHLADCPSNSVVDASLLVRRIREIVAEASSKGADKIVLVLLGDIFELLKSKLWISQSIRPWDEISEAHIRTVSSIFSGVLECNRSFFEGLQEISSAYSTFCLVYVPGNHDRVLNTGMGVDARRNLRQVLSVQGNDSDLFGDVLAEPEHMVVAKHGHQWDSQNRYTSRGAAIGDAVVIELVVRLADLAERKLGLSVDDPFYRAISEIDNVRPQAPRYMAQWLISHLRRIDRNKHKNIERVLEEILREILSEFQAVLSKVSFESSDAANWWEKFLRGAIGKWVDLFGVVNTSLVMPEGGESIERYAEFAGSDLQIAAAEADYRYILCGHTHMPEIVPLGPSREEASPLVYLNTGAWRRVHRATRSRHQPWAFASWNESCLVTIANADEQDRGFAAYEFHRAIRT